MKISAVAHPNTKNPRIEKDLFNTFHIYVKEPPLDGKANKAVIDALARHFRTKKAGIILLSGEKSKNKVFEIIEE